MASFATNTKMRKMDATVDIARTVKPASAHRCQRGGGCSLNAAAGADGGAAGASVAAAGRSPGCGAFAGAITRGIEPGACDDRVTPSFRTRRPVVAISNES